MAIAEEKVLVYKAIRGQWCYPLLTGYKQRGDDGGKKQERQFRETRTTKIVSFTSELFWFYDLEAIISCEYMTSCRVI